jgi:hypothetical protein
MTHVSKPTFSLTLPGNWTERAANEGFDFVSNELGEQVLVSVLEAKKPLNRPELKAAVQRLVEIRSQSVIKLSGGQAKLEATESLPLDDGVAARFAGIDSANQVQFITEIKGYPLRVVTVSFYRYSLGAADEFRLRAKAVMETLTLEGIQQDHTR